MGGSNMAESPAQSNVCSAAAAAHLVGPIYMNADGCIVTIPWTVPPHSAPPDLAMSG
jgi:hypothetical protein